MQHLQVSYATPAFSAFLSSPLWHPRSLAFCPIIDPVFCCKNSLDLLLEIDLIPIILVISFFPSWFFRLLLSLSLPEIRFRPISSWAMTRIRSFVFLFYFWLSLLFNFLYFREIIPSKKTCCQCCPWWKKHSASKFWFLSWFLEEPKCLVWVSIDFAFGHCLIMKLLQMLVVIEVMHEQMT